MDNLTGYFRLGIIPCHRRLTDRNRICRICYRPGTQSNGVRSRNRRPCADRRGIRTLRACATTDRSRLTIALRSRPYDSAIADSHGIRIGITVSDRAVADSHRRLGYRIGVIADSRGRRTLRFRQPAKSSREISGCLRALPERACSFTSRLGLITQSIRKMPGCLSTVTNRIRTFRRSMGSLADSRSIQSRSLRLVTDCYGIFLTDNSRITHGNTML